MLAEAERAPDEVRRARFETVFYGGGTPSRLEPADFLALAGGLAALLDLSRAMEVTLEANPEDVLEERLNAWQKGGVTRLSIGVQSLDAAELRKLGRPHGVDGALSAMSRARRHFTDWSCDLMFGFPGHGPASWQRTLSEAMAQAPPHVSAYHFTPEAGTPMGQAVRSGRVQVPGDDEAGALLEMASRELTGAGYRHYEISNYARPGHESRHNRLYWTGAPYWGLGPSAVGTWEGVRRENVRDASAYAARVEGGLPAAEKEYPVGAEAAVERVMMGLRLEEGIAWSDLESLGRQADAWRDAARAAIGEGWLVGDERGFRLAPERRAVADEAAERLWRWAEKHARSKR